MFAFLAKAHKQQPLSNEPAQHPGDAETKSGMTASSSSRQLSHANPEALDHDSGRAMTSELARLHEEFAADKTCFDSLSAVEAARHEVEYCNSPSRSPEPRAIAMCNRVQAMFPSGHPTVRDFARRDCPTSDALAAQYFNSMFVAARAGDVDAQYCYLDRDHQLLAAVEEKLTDAERQEIGEIELDWTRKGFQRGDWRIVEYVARHLAEHHNSYFLVVAVPGLQSIGDDIEMVQYYLDRLLRLGATGVYARELDDQLDALTGRGVYKDDPERTAVLSAADVSVADAWAKATFDQYFARSGVLASRPPFCENPHLAAVFGH